MRVEYGSPQWGSLIEGLDAARLVERLLEELVSNRLVASADPEVELVFSARVGRSGGRCVTAELVVRLGDGGVAGLEPRALRGLSDVLERMGLDVAGLRGGEGYVELVLRVERMGDC
jgi:hypothetical protein